MVKLLNIICTYGIAYIHSSEITSSYPHHIGPCLHTHLGIDHRQLNNPVHFFDMYTFWWNIQTYSYTLLVLLAVVLRELGLYLSTLEDICHRVSTTQSLLVTCDHHSPSTLVSWFWTEIYTIIIIITYFT